MIDPTRPLQKTLSIDLPATNQRSVGTMGQMGTEETGVKIACGSTQPALFAP